jgi:cytochrome c-type biogenesis protein CcmH
MRLAVVVVVLLALVAVPGALASEEQPGSLEVQQELYCTDCDTTLADASAVSYTPEAISYIEDLIAKGDTKSEIKKKVADRYLGHLIAMPSKADGERPTLADLEGEVMCPVCNTTLDQSSSPAARQIKSFIAMRIQAGDSKDQIKDNLVAEYGPQILAAPPTEGFDLLAWLLPLVGLVGGALVLAALAWHWSRRRGPPPRSPALSPAAERRVDEELARFDEG